MSSVQEYLPFILHEIETQPRRQYLLLHSLKEVISAQSASPTGVQVRKPTLTEAFRLVPAVAQ
jgi:cullin-associated NEDD8-dissociated protein 1